MPHCAGRPAGNLVLCFYLAVILAIFGIPVYSSSPIVGYVSTNYPSLNIKPGDKVVLVNGKKPKNWNFILGETYATDSTNLTTFVLRGEERITNEVPIILPNLVTPKLPLSPEQQLVRRPAPMVNERIVTVDGSTNFNGDTFSAAMRQEKSVMVTYVQDHQMHKEEWKINAPPLYSLWEVNPPVIYENPTKILGGTTWMMGKSILQILVPKTNLRLEI